MQSIERISTLKFQATDDDIALSKADTMTIAELSLKYNNTNFKLIDLGNKRSDALRRKWLSMFQDSVVAVWFIVGLSEYDQVLLEDPTTNSLNDAIEMFRVLCHSQCIGTPIILFLNKRDLFAEKLRRVDLSDFFPEYTGGHNFDKGCEFVTSKFINCSYARDVFVHVTCATDSSNMQFVFAAVRDTVLSMQLRAVGF
eukprot:c601_g1_i1.p1 GENE.c601_g1_i1~~c601_g1_i1.p1  ORF type:complete len:198 (+),score=61.09 c601_g1_i1:520-1113(+)